MPAQTTYSLQRGSEPTEPLRVSNELYEYLGFGTTPFIITMISRVGFKKIKSHLDDTWHNNTSAYLEFTIDAGEETGPIGRVDQKLADLHVIDFSFLSPLLDLKIKEILVPETDYEEFVINANRVMSVNFGALEKLHAHPDFAHISAFIFNAPLPRDRHQVINFLAIVGPSIIEDILNLNNVEQAIEIRFGTSKPLDGVSDTQTSDTNKSA